MLKKWLREMHWGLIGAVLLLLGIGTLFIYSASYQDSGHYMMKHFFWVVISVMILFVTPFWGYRKFLSVSYLFYAIAILLLVYVLIAGQISLGAQRWIRIGSLVIQPSEFAKIATVLAMANLLGSRPQWEKGFQTVMTAVLMGAVPFFLIVKQPDLGSAILFLPIMALLLYLWGLRHRIYISIAVLAGLAFPLFWQFLKEYQKQRILVFLNPTRDPLGAGYTAIQSKIAVGSGGLFGKGYLQGTQGQLQFVPEHHTDFIFCMVGEEWGFMGALLLLCLYAFLFTKAFQVMESTTDPKAKFLIAGILIVLFSQIFINIGMTFGLMPIAGLTLPLVSYGGSSLVMTSFALGLILSVYKERSIF